LKFYNYPSLLTWRGVKQGSVE